MPATQHTPVENVAGVAIPKLGLGTWELRGELCSSIVASAIEAGYRLIDTAQGYENEAQVAEGIARSGIAREALFITTKVRPDRLSADKLRQSVEASLEKLGTSYIDLLLLHWPNPDIPLEETIPVLNEVQRAGLARAIGLSNFTSKLLARAWELTEVPFAAEQIEYHPYLAQGTMLAALRQRQMAIMAYCPIALGKVASDPDILDIARSHGRTPVQVTLRWLTQQDGLVAIPRTSKPERLAENFGVFDFALGEEEMARMSALTRPDARIIDEPQWVPEWD
ncbi:MAG: aldo/keto reductase [Rhizobiaceae bacterium]|nr:aldo/keto reductase [Rhizobiaceae bacterium]